jgi:hypothetical protein
MRTIVSTGMVLWLVIMIIYSYYSHRVELFNRVAEDVLEYGSYIQWTTEDTFQHSRHVTPGYKNPMLQLTKEQMTI